MTYQFLEYHFQNKMPFEISAVLELAEEHCIVDRKCFFSILADKTCDKCNLFSFQIYDFDNVHVKIFRRIKAVH